MDFTFDTYFEDFEGILRRILEHFQELEKKEEFEKLYDKINFFHGEKIEIEDFDKTLKSRTRPLRIGFVGGFSTGKSSIINSLIGEDLLGVKLEPATSQITELSYGEKFEILEVTEDEDYFYYEEVTVEEYQKRSTTRGKKIKSLSHYNIKHPSKNLSRFTIVDTPGFSSTSKEDDELTRYWVESLDLLIWVFDANKVGDKAEYDKLKELGGRVKVIGVINKIDSKSPGVREKIRREILNDNILDDVFFYSSKKVLDECAKNKTFNDILENITSQIKTSVNNLENFEISHENSQITFKTSGISKPFSLAPLIVTSYSEYHDVLINKIDNVRNDEINLILNQTLVKKHNDFRNNIKQELLQYHEIFNKYLSKINNLLKEKKDLSQKSHTIYNDLVEDFDEKLNASFKVFYTSFFDDLIDSLLYKVVDTGLFSDDVYIHIKNFDNKKSIDKLHGFISHEFHFFLENSFDIYEKLIKNSIYKEISDIEEIRKDIYHVINTIVDGLIDSSVDSIIGYQRNFEPYKTESFLESKEFHKANIDLVVPDEFLKISISKILIADLIDASLHYESSLEMKAKKLEVDKNVALEILNMIDELLQRIN